MQQRFQLREFVLGVGGQCVLEVLEFGSDAGEDALGGCVVFRGDGDRGNFESGERGVGSSAGERGVGSVEIVATCSAELGVVSVMGCTPVG